MLAGFLLGMDNGVAKCHFVHPATGRDECHAINDINVVVQDLFRQTGGFCKVPSGGAVLDGDMLFVSHDDAFFRLSAAR